MFSDQVLDHFQNPRNAGELANPTAHIEVTNPVCGDILQLFAVIESRRITAIKFLCRGCTTAIACGSFLTEELKGKDLQEAGIVTAEAISEALGNLPPATYHAAQLAGDALRKLLAPFK